MRMESHSCSQRSISKMGWMSRNNLHSGRGKSFFLDIPFYRTHRRSRTPIVELKDNALWDIELDGSATPNCVGPRFNLTHLTNGVRHTLPSTLIGPQWPSLSSTIARYVLWSCDAADVPLKVLCSHEARETKATAKMALRMMAEC
jgi:hypothetical protein